MILWGVYVISLFGHGPVLESFVCLFGGSGFGEFVTNSAKEPAHGVQIENSEPSLADQNNQFEGSPEVESTVRPIDS